MKVSIITPTYNSALTIQDTVRSVVAQSHHHVEHIIIDGASEDKTLELARAAGHKGTIISEKDNGMYDAMNKGIQMAKGEIIGILNSDDFFPDNDVISTIAKAFSDNKIDAVYGNIAFVKPDNLTKIVRLYSAKDFNPSKFRLGFMPPHPSFYVKKECYHKFGLYQLDYKIAADYELLMRFMYKNKIRCQYIPKDFVYMRTGGVSNNSFNSRYILNKEIVRACGENGVRTNMFKLSFKYFKKVFEYVKPLLPVNGK